MVKKWVMLIGIVCLALNASGCFLLLAGAAGGAGTAVWLNGKLTQEASVPFDKALQASRSGLSSMNLKTTKETVKEDIAQLMSNYTDGKTVWVDIHRVSDKASRIEVRVGATGDKDAARKILNAISSYL